MKPCIRTHTYRQTVIKNPWECSSGHHQAPVIMIVVCQVELVLVSWSVKCMGMLARDVWSWSLVSWNAMPHDFLSTCVWYVLKESALAKACTLWMLFIHKMYYCRTTVACTLQYPVPTVQYTIITITNLNSITQLIPELSSLSILLLLQYSWLLILSVLFRVEFWITLFRKCLKARLMISSEDIKAFNNCRVVNV